MVVAPRAKEILHSLGQAVDKLVETDGGGAVVGGHQSDQLVDLGRSAIHLDVGVRQDAATLRMSDDVDLLRARRFPDPIHKGTQRLRGGAHVTGEAPALVEDPHGDIGGEGVDTVPLMGQMGSVEGPCGERIAASTGNQDDRSVAGLDLAGEVVHTPRRHTQVLLAVGTRHRRRMEFRPDAVTGNTVGAVGCLDQGMDIPRRSNSLRSRRGSHQDGHTRGHDGESCVDLHQ